MVNELNNYQIQQRIIIGKIFATLHVKITNLARSDV
jgi:hypothetical protein